VEAFPLVGNWTSGILEMGKGKTGRRPWLGAGNNYKFSLPLLQFLKDKNLRFLSDINTGFPQIRGRLGWKNADSLDLPEAMRDEWNSFISLLCENFISLDRDSEDSLCWSKNTQNGSYSVKLGYKAWLEDNFVTHPKWWWKPLWKLKAPPRCKLTLWLAMNNKLLTWDNFLRRGWCGPNKCPLCKENQETITHLFVSVPMQEGCTVNKRTTKI
jgi:hypothetical protein